MIAALMRWLASMEAPREWPPRLRVSDRYADVRLTNQFGRAIRFRSDLVRGRALVINSMFTTCRGSCPVTSRKVQELRAALSPILGRRLSFASFTVEPEVDTPERLREYAAAHGAAEPADGLCDWHFLTGAPGDIGRLRRSLGLYDLDPVVDADPTQHASLLMFGNGETDRWAALPAAQRTALLVEAIRRVAGFTFEQRYGIRR